MKEFDPVHAAANGYTREDWDAVDSPELTDEELAHARPLKEVMPDLYAALIGARSERGLSRTKAPVPVPIDPDVAEKFRQTGEGWEARVNEVLRKSTISGEP